MMKDLKENNFNNVFAIDPEDISKIYQETDEKITRYSNDYFSLTFN